MTRALNQTVGRVIRSKTDHGLLILCDPRFKEQKYNLSDWTRSFIPDSDSRICDVESEVKSFFEKHGHKMTGSMSETIGAFEVGLKGKATSTKTIKLKSSEQKKEPQHKDLRETMMFHYARPAKVEAETIDLTEETPSENAKETTDNKTVPVIADNNLGPRRPNPKGNSLNIFAKRMRPCERKLLAKKKKMESNQPAV